MSSAMVATPDHTAMQLQAIACAEWVIIFMAGYVEGACGMLYIARVHGELNFSLLYNISLHRFCMDNVYRNMY